jgi:hypothetical protein
LSFRPKGEICKSNILEKFRFLTPFEMTGFEKNWYFSGFCSSTSGS